MLLFSQLFLFTAIFNICICCMYIVFICLENSNTSIINTQSVECWFLMPLTWYLQMRLQVQVTVQTTVYSHIEYYLNGKSIILYRSRRALLGVLDTASLLSMLRGAQLSIKTISEHSLYQGCVQSDVGFVCLVVNKQNYEKAAIQT